MVVMYNIYSIKGKGDLNIMALITCPECGHQVSNTAKICPECGYDISKLIRKQKELNRKQQLNNKIIQLEKEKQEYHDKQYKDIYDSIQLPDKPTTREIKLQIYYLIFWCILSFIVTGTNIFLKCKFDIFSLFAFIINIICIWFVVSICVPDVKEAKKQYQIGLDNYAKILKNPENYKRIMTENLIEEDEKIEEYENLIEESKMRLKNNGRKNSPSNYQSHRPQNIAVPHCPTCGSPNIEKISIGKKMKGSFFFGFMSKDVRSTFHCKNCGYKW